MKVVVLVGGWGWGKIEIKDQLSPAEAETGAELGNILIMTDISHSNEY